jgi:hypothetical protein
MSVPASLTLSPTSLDEYFLLPHASVHRLLEHPTTDLVVDGPRQRIELVVANADEIPARPLPRSVTLDRVVNGLSETAVRISVEAGGRPFAAYSLLVSTASYVAAGAPLDEAILSAVLRFKRMLESDEPTVAQVLGLYGELLVFNAVADQLTPDDALDSWIGPIREEHDFRLADQDLEVKTTSSESRTHRISSVDQLEPLPGRPLFLVSIQLTSGGTDGESLAQLISRTSDRCQRQRERFLDLCGGTWEGAVAATVGYRLRHEIRVFDVTGEFPTLTRASLLALGIAGEVTDVRYSINLDSRVGESKTLTNWSVA